jgi:hypothetical protein
MTKHLTTSDAIGKAANIGCSASVYNVPIDPVSDEGLPIEAQGTRRIRPDDSIETAQCRTVLESMVWIDRS